jgi:choline dehydrogenase
MLRRSVVFLGAPSQRADVVVIGGGLTGCLVASRLAMENLTTVLLEEGTNMTQKPQWERQLGSALYAHRLMKKGYETEYTTTPQRSFSTTNEPAAAGSDEVLKIRVPKLLGGSGIMGSKSWLFGDYTADWEGTPWDFRLDIAPRIQRLESLAVTQPHRGKYGKFPVTRATALSPCYRAFSAAMNTHVSLTSTFNRKDGVLQAGCGRPEVFVDPTYRTAHQTVDGYLMQTVKLQRPVHLKCNARVTKIAGDGKGKATHVSYVDEQGAVQTLTASTFVLAAGSIGSTKLACASAESLFGAESNANPAIGQGFWDCPSVVLQYQGKDNLMSHNCFADKVVQCMAFLAMKVGCAPPALSSSFDDLIAFWSSTGSTTDLPDIKFMIQPFTLDGAGNLPSAVVDGTIPHGFQIVIQLARPKSIGSITASGVNPNYFAEESDRVALQKGVALIKELVKSQSFLQIVARKGEHFAEFFESRGIVGGGLCAGTAVDAANFMLKGTDNVYVCDGSILPKPILGDRNPSLLALADKFADRYLNKVEVTAKVDAVGSRDFGSNEVKILY